jgi:hypothetical protein
MPAFNKTSIEVIDLPEFDKIPKGIPWPVDSMSLAHALGIKNRTLMYLVINRHLLYKQHTIPKKSGGKRVIHAPKPILKFVQTKVLERFLNPLTLPAHVGAYVANKTTRETAQVHAGKPILIVIDLKDFFPSTRRSWIRRTLQNEFGYSYKVASLLSDLMTVPMDLGHGTRYVVPQGAPTSGAICNWVANERLDNEVLKVCAKHGMAYTRYADDLAFSHKDRLDRKLVDVFIDDVSHAIKASGYKINYKKLRVTRSGRQQRLLGMTINEKPNVMRVHYRNLRARIHNCKCKGFENVARSMSLESGAKLQSQIEGMISYWHMINPQKAAKLKLQLEEAKTMNA